MGCTQVRGERKCAVPDVGQEEDAECANLVTAATIHTRCEQHTGGRGDPAGDRYVRLHVHFTPTHATHKHRKGCRWTEVGWGGPGAGMGGGWPNRYQMAVALGAGAANNGLQAVAAYSHLLS